ncbi:t-SNARE [Gigaspora margarita]|uniref:t-SNARE n=1 Tax=Gigaspora margarita TaxID=4874 RepID=A0A8H3XJ10_GIGMA|nr:t-SNARE [Gigaspora margarita]
MNTSKRQQKLLKNFQKILTVFQKVQRLSAERQREYVDKAKMHNVRNDAYEDDEVVIHETQSLINDNQRRLQFQVLDNEVEYNKSLIAEWEGEIREINKDLTAM